MPRCCGCIVTNSGSKDWALNILGLIDFNTFSMLNFVLDCDHPGVVVFPPKATQFPFVSYIGYNASLTNQHAEKMAVFPK